MLSVSRRASIVLVSAVSGVSLFSGANRAMATVLSGTIDYTDFDSNAQAVRDGLVDIYSTNGTTRTLLGTATTNSLGAWTADFTAGVGSTGYVVTAVAQNNATSVSAGTLGLSGGAIAPVVINTQTGSFAEKAFMLADAMYTSYLYSAEVRGTALPSLPTLYGSKAITGTDDSAAFYNGSAMVIGAGSVYDWDTENHEYGHYMADSDHLDQNPGGEHSLGVSDIPVNGRLNGVRLAWGEGLASYNGI